MKNAAKARMSLTDYIILTALQADIYVREDTRPMLTELKRIGNNINQIAMKVNAGVFASYNFQDIVNMQKKIYEELYRISQDGEPWQP